jgi:hypothetical protein
MAEIIGYIIRERVHAANARSSLPRPGKHIRCITLSRPAGCRKYFHDNISAVKGD